MKQHQYTTLVTWEGNLGRDTAGYTAYSRDHSISNPDKTHLIKGSSDPSFRGDSTRYNPEELFLSSLASCHMLWYLHLCSEHGIMVFSYTDSASGTMQENADGSGSFTRVTLKPRVEIRSSENISLAHQLHTEAGKRCFIANSCNFPVEHHAEIIALTKPEDRV